MKVLTKNYQVKSVVISRKPGRDKDGLWSAFMGLFQENNPHLKAKEPFKVLEIKEVEKVRINGLKNISYYLMGNDIVINDLVTLNIERKGSIVILTGEQKLEY